MVRLVACFQRALVFDDAFYLHALPCLALVFEQRLAAAGLRVLEGGGEHRVAGAVGLVDARGHGLGVGDVGSNGVQARVLRTHAATGNVEDTGKGHGHSPRRAETSPLNLLLSKVKLAWKLTAFSV
ncbi:hypothetical protein D3C75_958370 [compost metagenome]